MFIDPSDLVVCVRCYPMFLEELLENSFLHFKLSYQKVFLDRLLVYSTQIMLPVQVLVGLLNVLKIGRCGGNHGNLCSLATKIREVTMTSIGSFGPRCLGKPPGVSANEKESTGTFHKSL